MSTTAEELLNSLTEEEIAAYTATPDEEPHIIVDENRKITVPEELKRIAVQYDHNIETVTFDCIRYWDDHDMSTMHVYINYMLNNKALGSYLADDVTVDPDDENIIHFTWTISRNVTQAVGPITFLVCVKRVDENGNEANHWNSELNKEMFVNQGLECGEPIAEDYPDIIEKILLNMDALTYQNKYPAWERYNADGVYVDETGYPVGGVSLYGVNESGGNIPAPFSIVAGLNCAASGVASFAQGIGCESTGAGSLTFGSYSKSSGVGSAAFGNYSEATADGQFVIGKYNTPDSTEEGAVQHAFIIGNGEDTSKSNAMTVDWDGNLEIAGGITTMDSKNANSLYDADGNRKGLLAIGGGNHATGGYSVAIGGAAWATGDFSLAIGRAITASGNFSLTIGSSNHASGEQSVAIGGCNIASGYNSVALCAGNTASGNYSVAIGCNTKASADKQFVIGKYNTPDSTEEGAVQHAFIIGNGTDKSGSNAMTVDWDGNLEIAGGITTLNAGNSIYDADGNRKGLLALGGTNTASGGSSVALGGGNTASGDNSLAIGGGNTASSTGSVALGGGNTASGLFSSAIGGSNHATGNYSVALCSTNTASGTNSVAIGSGNTASGNYSVAMGLLNTANVDYQFVIGKYNTPDSTEEGAVQHAFIIGNGTDANTKSNAMTVDWDGNVFAAGNVTATGSDGNAINLRDIATTISTLQSTIEALTARIAALEGSTS